MSIHVQNGYNIDSDHQFLTIEVPHQFPACAYSWPTEEYALEKTWAYETEASEKPWTGWDEAQEHFASNLHSFLTFTKNDAREWLNMTDDAKRRIHQWIRIKVALELFIGVHKSDPRF